MLACRSRKKNKKRNPVKRLHRRSGFEPLECRQMLAAGNLFAEFIGLLNQPGDVEKIPITIAPQKLGIADTAFLGFQVSSRSGGSFDPAAVQIRAADGTLVKPEYASADLPNATDSVVLAGLARATTRWRSPAALARAANTKWTCFWSAT